MTPPKQDGAVTRLLVASIILNFWLGCELQTVKLSSAEHSRSIDLLTEQLRRERETIKWQEALDRAKSDGTQRRDHDYESH